MTSSGSTVYKTTTALQEQDNVTKTEHPVKKRKITVWTNHRVQREKHEKIQHLTIQTFHCRAEQHVHDISQSNKQTTPQWSSIFTGRETHSETLNTVSTPGRRLNSVHLGKLRESSVWRNKHWLTPRQSSGGRLHVTSFYREFNLLSHEWLSEEDCQSELKLLCGNSQFPLMYIWIYMLIFTRFDY